MATLDAFKEVSKFLAGVSREAVPAGEDAAAKVFLAAAQAAAPKKSGGLQRSIKIVKGKSKRLFSTGNDLGEQARKFVGPEKKKGYYGFFVEKGHKARSGKSSDLLRKTVAARPWFEPAMKAVEDQALSAAENAVNQKLEELNSKV